jgi:cytolysin (calcineurin-like family phosphatase)
MQKTIQQLDADLQDQIVGQVLGISVTRRAASQAFDKVADPQNWKNPIDATIAFADDYELELVKFAVVFFAGCQAKVTILPAFAGGKTRARIRAVGYYVAVGA